MTGQGEAEVETCKKWRHWRQISAQKNLAVMDEMDVGGHCVRVRQEDSSMLSLTKMRASDNSKRRLL